jgi:hypothetical protein
MRGIDGIDGIDGGNEIVEWKKGWRKNPEKIDSWSNGVKEI